jgi:DNA-binding response OmpR family regulator
LRVLVLDESQLLAWMVGHFAPPGTSVVGLTSFDAARRALLESPPDAAVVSISSPHTPWREFRKLCSCQRPPVPVLFASSVFASAADAGLEPELADALFLRTPATKDDLQSVLARLFRVADAAGIPDTPQRYGG